LSVEKSTTDEKYSIENGPP
ncbi:unnamed protein product, partial [Rotaria sp. Silwood2]